jgi:hypothetical protein
MKYCPNPSCRHARRFKSPAEFADRATSCNDCGMDLVARDELDTDDTKLRVQAFHDRRARADAAIDDAEAREIDLAASARVDIITGIVLFVLGALLFVLPMIIADSTGGTKVFLITIPAMGYGIYRLERGLSTRRALRAKQPSSPAAGPYRT